MSRDKPACTMTLMHIWNQATHRYGLEVAGRVHDINGGMVKVEIVRSFTGQAVARTTQWYPRNQVHIDFGAKPGRRF